MKKRFLIAFPIVIFCLLLIWYFVDDIRMIPNASSVRTYQWRAHISRSDLQIRKLKSDENILLLKPTVRAAYSGLDLTEGALQFDPANKTFRQIPQQTWEEAQGQIKTCEQFSLPEGYKTYGRYALFGSIDSNGQNIAVLSAAGPRIPPLFSFFSGQATGRILGTRYVEVFNRENPHLKSDPIRVGSEDDLDLCWSPDDNSVVVYSTYFTSISVTEVGKLQ